MEVGEALTHYVEEHIERHVNKYFDTAITADVHFSKQGNEFQVKMVINEGVKNGIVIKSDGAAGDAYGATVSCVRRGCQCVRGRVTRLRVCVVADAGA